MSTHRNHIAYWAFLLHRLSGILLVIFLPMHFYALGLALDGPEALDGFLTIGELPLVKVAEWGLVSLLALHLCLGLRVLVLEFFPWPHHRQARLGWIALAALVSLLTGFTFLLRVF